MIVAFTGTRHGLTQGQLHSLEQQLSLLAPVEVHHGDCVGADAAFDALCRCRDCMIHLHPATLDRFRAWSETTSPTVVHCPEPSLKRNQLMVAACDLLVATPATADEVLRSGTWATIRHARKLGKRVVLIQPDGSVDDSLHPETIMEAHMAANDSEELIQRKRSMIADALKEANKVPVKPKKAKKK